MENPADTELACVVGRRLVNPKGNKISIRLLNPSPNKVKICTGMTVASIEFVEYDMQEKVAIITDSDNSLPSLIPAKASMLETLACDAGDNLTEQQRSNSMGC